MFFLYQIIISILIIFSPIIVVYRIFIAKEDKKRFIEKFSISTKKRGSGKLIWFHVASVGEILSIIPLIKNYEKSKSINKILITSSTLSSSKIIEKFKFKKIIHQFYPIDHNFFVDRFLNFWKPSLAIFIESEVWPCMFSKIHKKKIPLILLNARFNKKSIRRWLKIKNFAKKIFNNITIAFPQNIETKLFLRKMRINNMKFLGNLKFVESDIKNSNRIKNDLKKKFRAKKVWIATSTHADEEIFCAKAHIELKKKVKNLITIIIPRHIHRTSEIIQKIKKLDLKVVSHNETKKKLINDTDIYIVDIFGETKKFHQIGCSVFLGGSIIDRGGQNPLEAARYGANILHGPNVDNFEDVYKLLKSFKVSKKITSIKQLASSIKFKKDKIIVNRLKKIGRIILKKTIKELDDLINNEFKKT